MYIYVCMYICIYVYNIYNVKKLIWQIVNNINIELQIRESNEQ